jgi:hypothetical protein
VDDELRHYAKVYVVAALLGTGMGVGYMGLTWFLRRSLLAESSLGDVVSQNPATYSGPSDLYCIGALGFGWLIARLANRLIDTHGSVNLGFIGLATVFSVGIGFGGSHWLVAPLPAGACLAMGAMCGVVTLVMAGWFSYFE